MAKAYRTTVILGRGVTERLKRYGKCVYSSSWETLLRATGRRRLPYWITQCYRMPPDTSDPSYHRQSRGANFPNSFPLG